LFRRFGEWTRRHFPKLDSAQLGGLKKIRRVRNLESHEAAPLDVNEVPGLCRGFLDALLAGSAEEALPSSYRGASADVLCNIRGFSGFERGQPYTRRLRLSFVCRPKAGELQITTPQSGGAVSRAGGPPVYLRAW
jgi:hypothetical protein